MTGAWYIKGSSSVFAYDHTIKAQPNRGKNIRFYETGLGIGSDLKRLETIIKENNHTDSVIEYLKVHHKTDDKTPDIIFSC